MGPCVRRDDTEGEMQLCSKPARPYDALTCQNRSVRLASSGVIRT